MLASLGIVASCVAGLIWVIKKMFNDVTPALQGLVKATESNTMATKSADTYLRERNGRDNEHHAKVVEAIDAIPEKMQAIADTQAITLVDNLKKVPQQNIEHQNVQEQTVTEKK